MACVNMWTALGRLSSWCVHTALSQAQKKQFHIFHSHPVCSLWLTTDHSATWWRRGSVVGVVDSTIQEYNRRCTSAARWLSGWSGERSDARENSEAKRRSWPPVVTCSSERPRVSHRLSTTTLWQTQWRVLLLRHSQRHEQNLWTAVLSRSWTSSGRSGLAGTTGQQYNRATHRRRMLTCTMR